VLDLLQLDLSWGYCSLEQVVLKFQVIKAEVELLVCAEGLQWYLHDLTSLLVAKELIGTVPVQDVHIDWATWDSIALCKILITVTIRIGRHEPIQLVHLRVGAINQAALRSGADDVRNLD
jgi:hypothetical protein